MTNKIKILRNKLKQYNIDGYVVPKNDEYFTEYSRVNRLKVISNFSGSAGVAIILKNNDKSYFIMGTLALIIINSGLCFLGEAIILKIQLIEKKSI